MSQSRPQKCSHCTQPTTLHLTKIVDGQVFKLDLCAVCPQAKRVKSEIGFDLVEGGAPVALAPRSAESKLACPGCGLTPGDFKESGRLGCSRCYETFEEKLSPLFMKLHESSEHVGKAPQGKRKAASPEQIELLRRRLRELVSREEYELAATVRDQLKALEH